MSTIYFQYTEGEAGADSLYLYLKTIKDDTIPIPKKVGKDSGAVNFEDYLNSLDSVPTIDNNNVPKMKDYYRTKLEEKFPKLKTDIDLINDYIKNNTKYKKYKEHIKNVRNNFQYDVEININENGELNIYDESDIKPIIDEIKKTITFSYEDMTGLKSTIDEIKQIEKEKVEKPEIPKLELLKDVKYDDFNEDKILYVFSQKNEWSLDASELYKDLNPSK